ncbi:lipid-binding SYLF domain-containing protein [Nisaea sp.]|uniref:lipid-binding SYLF domain-containing protein n=1 Tax=Nisaea sp. TaxID=2024842 RepID=UPI003B522FF4
MIKSILLRLVVLSAFLLVIPGGARADDAKTLAASSESALEYVNRLLKDERWAGARNLIGAAKGVAIITDVKKASFIVGYESGNGVILSRHGEDWSDPIAIRMSATSLAFQAGAQEADIIMVILTRSALNELVEGIFKVGGSGGFALGEWGAGGRAGGSISGGVEVLTLSISEGLFLGGGIEGMNIALNEDANNGAYGESVGEVLAKPGGETQGAVGLREALSKAVRQSWFE